MVLLQATARTVSAWYRALAAARQASRQHACLCSGDAGAVVPAAVSFPPHAADLGNVLAVPSHRGTLWNSLELLLAASPGWLDILLTVRSA